MLIDTQKHEVPRNLQSEHAERHMGVVVLIWIRPGRGRDICRAWCHLACNPHHAERHVEHEVPRRMHPESCEATHGLPHGWFLIGCLSL
ncbi:hypothetical protein N665_1006s0017 [Sinapis alba]|nr:hypothetical protein N665_1006s0017 [Sinapis alba]